MCKMWNTVDKGDEQGDVKRLWAKDKLKKGIVMR